MSGVEKNEGAGKRGPLGKRGQARERILIAAHDAFTELDYSRATYREIARRAEVDPALIAYYFKSKAQLLRASLHLPEDPKTMISTIISSSKPDELGRNIAAAILNTWEQAATAGTLATLFNLLLRDASTQQVFASYVEQDILTTVKGHLNTDSTFFLELMMSAILGVLLSRYIVKLEPLASLERTQLTDTLGVIIQQVLEYLNSQK